MKKLSEFKDDEAMEALAELIEPTVNLIGDKTFRTAVRGDKEKNIKPDKIKAVKIALKDHKDDVVKILAVLNETPVEDFHYNLGTLPIMVLQLFNDKELYDFFKSQGEKDSATSSGSVTENTEETENTSSDM